MERVKATCCIGAEDAVEVHAYDVDQQSGEKWKRIFVIVQRSEQSVPKATVCPFSRSPLHI
jgi:hypothetical protein